jgi:hypothetical protein
MNQIEELNYSEELASMTAEEMAQSIRDFSREALAALRERQEKAYAAECGPFNEELRVLAGEAADIQTESQGFIERMASAERVRRFEADQLIMQGKKAEAQAKLVELEEIKAAPAKIEKRRLEIEERVGQIEVEKRTALRRVAEDFKEASIALIRGCEAGLSGIIDGARNTLNTLEIQVGASIYQPAQLTADEKSAEWTTLHRLYAGRV